MKTVKISDYSAEIIDELRNYFASGINPEHYTRREIIVIAITKLHRELIGKEVARNDER